MNIHHLISEWQQMTPAQWAENKYGWTTDGKPVTLAEWQRVVLEVYQERKQDVDTLLISAPKKSGKTFLDSLLLCYRWLTLPGLHLAIGNDSDQSAELQIAMIGAMVRTHPLLRRFVKINRSELIFEPTGSRILSLPMDAGSAAGGNFLTTSWTELWAFVHEGAERLFEELTILPLTDQLRIIDSYAGFSGESNLLQRIWDRALTGERVHPDWPIYQTGRMLAFIAQGEDAQAKCWRGTPEQRVSYYSEQEATLRPLTYQRLHLNLWASSESTFCPIEWWDRAATAQPIPGDRTLSVVLGVDAALKRDSAAVVAVAYDHEQRKARLVAHRVFFPKKGQTLDLEDTLETAVKDFAQRFHVLEVRYDPWQFARSAQTLSKAGIKMIEYPQSVPNLTAMSTNLWELLKGNNLIGYPDEDIRLACQRAVAVEGARGLKIAKEKASHRIDLWVALAIAALGAIEELGQGPATVEVLDCSIYDFPPMRSPAPGQLFDDCGRFLGAHKPGITWENCPHRRWDGGCAACDAEIYEERERRRREDEARYAACLPEWAKADE